MSPRLWPWPVVTVALSYGRITGRHDFGKTVDYAGYPQTNA